MSDVFFPSFSKDKEVFGSHQMPIHPKILGYSSDFEHSLQVVSNECQRGYRVPFPLFYFSLSRSRRHESIVMRGRLCSKTIGIYMKGRDERQ